MIQVLILIEEIFYSLGTMKVAVIVILALLSCFQASPVGYTHSVISSNRFFFSRSEYVSEMKRAIQAR